MSIKTFIEPLYEAHLARQCIYRPSHIAIIQDGNRRYAKSSGLDSSQGHRAGAQVTEKMLEWARELGIPQITLYSFSTENFNRSEEEIEALFSLFKEKFMDVITDERVTNYHMRVRMVGDRSLLPDDLKAAVELAEEATKHNSSFFLNIALAYGGRNEILEAARRILAKVRAGSLSPDEISRTMVEEHLHEGMDLPPVDLVIRTGNEYRTSNFLPWLANGHESAVYFSAPYWPMFRKIDFLRAIRVYSQRQETRINARNA